MKRMVLLAAAWALWAGFAALQAGAGPHAAARLQASASDQSARPRAGRVQAMLYVFDTSGKTLVPSKNIVMDNGKKVAETRRARYVILPLEPGHHVVWLKYGPKDDKVELDAAAGQTYYTAGGYHPMMPAALSNTTFGQISAEQAEHYLAEMKPMTAEAGK